MVEAQSKESLGPAIEKLAAGEQLPDLGDMIKVVNQSNEISKTGNDELVTSTRASELIRSVDESPTLPQAGELIRSTDELVTSSQASGLIRSVDESVTLSQTNESIRSTDESPTSSEPIRPNPKEETIIAPKEPQNLKKRQRKEWNYANLNKRGREEMMAMNLIEQMTLRKGAIVKELQQMELYGVWDAVKESQGKKVLQSFAFISQKFDTMGNLKDTRARLSLLCASTMQSLLTTLPLDGT
jgi:hypothetical protein